MMRPCEMNEASSSGGAAWAQRIKPAKYRWNRVRCRPPDVIMVDTPDRLAEILSELARVRSARGRAKGAARPRKEIG
jgi:hypothetical protein